MCSIVVVLELNINAKDQILFNLSLIVYRLITSLTWHVFFNLYI